MIHNINFKCLICESGAHKDHHHCNSMCRPLAQGVEHIDFCLMCVHRMINSFEYQVKKLKGGKA